MGFFVGSSPGVDMENVMENEKSNIEKIYDEGVRELALTQSDDKVSVMIVVGAPTPLINTRNKSNTHTSFYSKFEFAEEPQEKENEKEKDTKKKAKRVGNFLESILGFEPNYIHQSKAFVATVSGTQLSVIVDHPDVKSIYLNRDLE